MPSDPHAGPAPIRVRIEAETDTVGPYEVLIRDGLLADAGTLIREAVSAHRYAIISDDNVAAPYAAAIRASVAAASDRVDVLTFPPGEGSKTRASWASLTDDLLRLGHGRDSCVIVVGGGVAGDLGGFVAATFMRGIPFVNVPTTLLAMLDSAVGGKTGVDTADGKNLVGAFHQPSLVLIDPSVLGTLPEPAYRASLAEAIKHGVIADADYFDWILAHAADLEARDADAVSQLVKRSVEIKAAVVAEDVRETGRRAILNFGHTIGHAVERISGYAVPHGFAVAMGMASEARVGEHLGVTEQGTADRIRGSLVRFDLPADLTGLEVDGQALAEATRTDKKARASRVRYALPERIGRMHRDPSGAWTTAVDDEAIRTVATGRRGAISQVRTEF